MATIEKRLQALEQENAARKKAEELLTIAIRAFVSKEAFEKLRDTVEKLQETMEKSQEQNGKIFDIINNHNIFTNERLGDIQSQLIETDGKVAGLQTEMRQRFNEQDGKIVGLQTEMRQRFNEQDGKFAELDNRVTGLDSRVTGLQTEMRQRFNEQDGKITGLQTTQAEHTALLHQILARLPE